MSLPGAGAVLRRACGRLAMPRTHVGQKQAFAIGSFRGRRYAAGADNRPSSFILTRNVRVQGICQWRSVCRRRFGRSVPSSVPRKNAKSQDFSFHLGGLTARGSGQPDEHLEWLQIDQMKAGGTVTIEIIETSAVHPVTGAIGQAEQDTLAQRQYCEHCKKTYFELRSKFEGESGSVDQA